jgi:hypothetical protein
MKVLGVIVAQSECIVVEADYLQFVFDLSKRLGSAAEQVRPGLPTVDERNATDFTRYMGQYCADLDGLEKEWLSMNDAERLENVSEFLPTVLIDFPARQFAVSHPEAEYLNLTAYVPDGWTVDRNVLSMVPEGYRYWRSWPGLPTDLSDF